MFNNQILAGSSGQGGITQQSLKFNDDESQYLSWTPAAAGNRKTWTFSAWVKLGSLTQGERGTIFQSSGGPTIYQDSGLRFAHSWDPAGTDYIRETVAVFRDPSAWYHVVWWCDTTQAGTRWKIYVNGTEQTLQTPSGNNGEPAQNTDLGINSTNSHTIGVFAAATYFDGYMADVYFIDGQALDATSFGQFTDGYWEKKDYAGSYGTNGFHLTFQDDVVSEGFNVTTYNASQSNQSISGIGFSPDLVFAKNRDSSSNARWGVIDSVRGVNKTLATNMTAAEVTSRSDLLTSFDADGFSLGADADAYGWNNQNYTAGDRQVAFCWDAGSGSPVSNTDGSITSTVKANPSYGFSIVSYTSNASGQDTVGHGLASTPEMIITKSRDGSTFNWSVFHADVTDTTSKFLRLNTTDSILTYSTIWGAALPTSSVFGITSGGGVEASDACIAYCFHSVAGYSSIGSYSGTGASGNTITTGFEPAFVMIKATSISGEAWWMFDNTRSTTDPRTKHLRANTSDTEDTSASGALDFTSTGFEHQGSEDGLNKSGTTYIYMAFADTREAAFWKDVSGQGNHWQPNNLDYRDSLIDSPANNFCVYNPLDANTSTLSEGNLKVATASTTSVANTRGTLAVNSGKWYWEIITVDSSSSLRIQSWAGLASTERATNSVVKILVATGNGIIYGNNGSLQSGLTAWSQYDVIGVALDCGNTSVQFYRNGSAYGSAVDYSSFIPSTEFLTPFIIDGASSVVCTTVSNFGQDSTFSGARPAGGNTDANNIGDFAYAPPSGYLALCTANLPEPTIVDGSEHFNSIAWSGAASTQQLPLNFTPDFVWAKRRNGADSHRLYDVIRGENQDLQSNSTSAELTNDYGLDFIGHDYLEVDSTKYFGASGNTFVGWNWKAGGTAVSNTDGSITSQVSANVDAGFSVVSWSGNTTSGATVGHGLGVAPDVIIFKRRDGTTDWHTYHSSISNGNTYLAYLNTNAVPASAGSFLNSTYPSSSVITLGNSAGTNGSSMIAYCFANSDTTKAGSYVANQNTDGPFIYLGFRPAFFLAKNISRVQEWIMMNNKTTDPYNPQDGSIQPNSSAAESTGNEVDFLSNGVKLRNSGGGLNYASGDTFIYLAFAENPFKYANAR